MNRSTIAESMARNYDEGKLEIRMSRVFLGIFVRGFVKDFIFKNQEINF